MPDICSLFLDEHEDRCCNNPDHCAALARRTQTVTPWGAIEHRADRDYLDGRPIHCGMYLLLQGHETHDDDYGGYTILQSTGVWVRYELAAPRHGDLPGSRVVLHTTASGHAFTAKLHPGMRFRWPKEED